ncbi:hypothetical protein O2W14_08545 [Modestobacter sp. VKM Ac-2986]|uniref:hypothetical protein n=1 Tax=Modestobacter sp. VKM Ac-2986 TaxID=3004140 RepID=UPI0022AB45A8|nr:hypothetical protein [Modestobacter sp. VKM Ac-2986]MCZ2828877.1 hypothetical protein [Modestobacter sp. VKM Ac-2986]
MTSHAHPEDQPHPGPDAGDQLPGGTGATEAAPGLLDGPAARAERIEAVGLHAFVTGLSAEARRGLGMSATRLGGAEVLALADDPTHYWSKALGFGVTEPVTPELITEVVRFYERSGAQQATIQIAPAALPEDWPAIAGELGLEQRPSWVKLQRDLAAAPAGLPAPTAGLRVAPVAEADLAAWARVLFSGFGMPPAYDSMGTGVDPTVCHRWAAWDGDRIVAGATVVIDGDAAGMFGAATLPGDRRRGAQSALLAARLYDAAGAGVRWVSAETGAEAAGQRNPSLHNLRRAGLVDLYERPNWLWRAR